MAKEISKKFRFESSSGNGVYETLLLTDGTTSCNCPGWTRRVATDGSRSCKHTKQVEARPAPPTKPTKLAFDVVGRPVSGSPAETREPVQPPPGAPPKPAAFPGVMLADKYDARAVRHWGDVWAEPKLDGMRLLLVRRGGVSQVFARSGKTDPYTATLRHIIAQMPTDRDDYAIDGELYADEGWGRTMTLAKRIDVSEEERRALKVRAFDFLDLSTGRRQPLTERRTVLERLTRGTGAIVPVPYRRFRAGDTEALDTFYREQLDAGYEGLILKNPDANYMAGQRSPAWMKMKPVATAEGVIIGFDPGEGRHEGRLGAVKINFEGTVVAVGGGYTDRQRDWIWANRPALIGGQLEFAYQKDTVAVARFPRFVRFRWDRARDPMAATFPV
jgi:ATP-dependent DNA ligase